MDEFRYKIGDKVVLISYEDDVYIIESLGNNYYNLKGVWARVLDSDINHEATAKLNQPTEPKNIIKDGWSGLQLSGGKVWFLPSIGYCFYDSTLKKSMGEYDSELINEYVEGWDIVELYDVDGNLKWKRAKKSPKQIEIEKLEKEYKEYASKMVSIGDKLTKLREGI